MQKETAETINDMICPLKLSAHFKNSNDFKCQDTCAWRDSETKVCAMVATKEILLSLGKAISKKK